MIIFLRNIHPDTKKYEIANFINPVFNDCFLDKSTAPISIEDIEILSILDVSSNRIEKHGLVRVFPNEVAHRLIKRLDGTLFKDKPITVREYVNRSAKKDPRNEATSDTANYTNRRVADRRRIPLVNSWQKDPVLVQSYSY